MGANHQPVMPEARQVRVLGGLHRGAQVALAGPGRLVFGSDAQCSIVLCDRGVGARHCALSVDEDGITCRALEGTVALDERELAPGEAASIEDFEIIRFGEVAMSVGPVDGDWSVAARALEEPQTPPLGTLRSLRRLNPYALFATLLLGLTCVIGLAYAALSERSTALTPSRVEAARQWLEDIAPAGSELSIGVELGPAQGLLLSGYVQHAKELTALARASGASAFDARLDVYAVDEMAGSLARLARLAAIPCDSIYRGAGHFACANAVAGEAIATKLRMLARDVPGLRSLEVPVALPVLAHTPVVPPALEPHAPAGPAQLTQKFSVLMFRNQRYLIGPYGERYTEGERFDGFTIDRIGLDTVRFERDGRQFEFHVAALRSPR